MITLNGGEAKPLDLKCLKVDRTGGRKEKEGRILERRFTGEARKTDEP